jgi:hypothetical protein
VHGNNFVSEREDELFFISKEHNYLIWLGKRKIYEQKRAMCYERELFFGHRGSHPDYMPPHFLHITCTKLSSLF